ncbi:hypothetical protein MBLNU459_g0148t1 [Dothideomycetes sp. NU459]
MHISETNSLNACDFFFDVLNASATRRDAKQYLARFESTAEKTLAKPVGIQKAVDKFQEAHSAEQWRLHRSGVNLGELYLPTRAAAESPTFIQNIQQDAQVQRGVGEIHIALVCMRSPHLVNDEVLDGIALTLSQLVRLDMQIVVVLDCAEELSASGNTQFKEVYRQQADKIVTALERHNNSGARYVDSALSLSDPLPRIGSVAPVKGSVAVGIPKLIIEPLKRGAIPVIPGIAHTKTSRANRVSAADVMLALTRTISGISPGIPYEEFRSVDETTLDMSLDRIIMLDPLGGLPSAQREDGAHVFVNLEQEYGEIHDELGSGSSAKPHLETLELVRGCLALLPPSSSAMLISPEEAASVSRSSSEGIDSIGISTRRQKNPLIHNLLTNKPMISSSLPVARLSATGIPHTTSAPTLATRSTLVKRGMPVTMVPDPRKAPWTPPKPGEPTIALENHPDINFPRLLALIEDSFRRPLDVKHYLKRIENRVAGVIIAGEYEGGAILTWEEPTHDSSAASSSPVPEKQLVPYLDKFAVLQRSQGSSGVADIVFQAMVRTCFPNGVCWRSRKDNPVNKWYFERSRGTWQLDGTQWTMFWTSEGLVQDKERWSDYVSVCTKIEPSWADNKKRPD